MTNDAKAYVDKVSAMSVLAAEIVGLIIGLIFSSFCWGVLSAVVVYLVIAAVLGGNKRFQDAVNEMKRIEEDEQRKREELLLRTCHFEDDEDDDDEDQDNDEFDDEFDDDEDEDDEDEEEYWKQVWEYYEKGPPSFMERYRGVKRKSIWDL